MLQFISYAIIMTLVSLILAVLLAFLVEPFFDNAFNTNLDLINQFTPGFTALIIVVILGIGLLAGLFPALIISRFTPIEVVKGTYNRKVRSTYSKVLITLQYTIAIYCLIKRIFILLQTNYMKNYE